MAVPAELQHVAAGICLNERLRLAAVDEFPCPRGRQALRPQHLLPKRTVVFQAVAISAAANHQVTAAPEIVLERSEPGRRRFKQYQTRLRT